jgi:hypothetical protein
MGIVDLALVIVGLAAVAGIAFYVRSQRARRPNAKEAVPAAPKAETTAGEAKDDGEPENPDEVGVTRMGAKFDLQKAVLASVADPAALPPKDPPGDP